MDLSWEVQYVKDIDWSPPDIIVFVSSKEIMEPWFVAFVDEGPSHLPYLPENSEEGYVRPRVTYPRT